MTFADPAVADLVRREFTFETLNRAPGFRQEIPPGYEYTARTVFPDALSVNDVVTFVAAPDGRVIHAIPGYWSPDAFRRELDWALRAARGEASHADLAGPVVDPRDANGRAGATLGAVHAYLRDHPGTTWREMLAWRFLSD